MNMYQGVSFNVPLNKYKDVGLYVIYWHFKYMDGHTVIHCRFRYQDVGLYHLLSL